MGSYVRTHLVGFQQAVHCAQLSIASCPLPSRPLRRAVHRELSIPTSSSHPSLHCLAIFCELSIASRPLLHRQAVIVHHELSIALLLSRPALYCRAVHRQAVHCTELSIASCPSRHRLAVHRSITKPFFASCLSRAVHCYIVKLSLSITSCLSLYRRAVQRFISEPSIAKLSIAEPSIFCRCQSSSNVESTNKSSIIHHILKSTIGLRGL